MGRSTRRLCLFDVLPLVLAVVATAAGASEPLPNLPAIEAEELTVTGQKMAATVERDIIVSQYGISDRPYQELQYISLSLRAEGRLDPPVTPESLAAALRRRAAMLGADAVIHVRFDQTGNSSRTTASGLAVIVELARKMSQPAVSRPRPAEPVTLYEGPAICSEYGGYREP
jgi:hypothetical protein